MGDWKQDRDRYGRRAWLLQPSYWAVMVYRFGRWTFGAPRPIAAIVHGVYFVAYSVVRLQTGIDIPRTARFGPGLMIHHFGGIIIHPQSVVGARCVMRQGVTIGTKTDGGKVPVLGDDVVIGAYAQVLGDIYVGDRATIGALSVVLQSVNPDEIVAGIPARVIGTRETGR
jgi:serine O-acetyltransferase